MKEVAILTAREKAGTRREPTGMQQFSTLLTSLDTSSRTNDKLDALSRYFTEAPPADRVWVIALFSGRRPKRNVNTRLLQEWCMETTGIPNWLFQECYQTVGDLAETIALLISDSPKTGYGEIKKLAQKEVAGNHNTNEYSLSYYLGEIQSLGQKSEMAKKEFILGAWKELDRQGRFVFNKLITGGFRIGISTQMVINALARTLGLEPAAVTHRISGKWDPATTPFESLFHPGQLPEDHSRPYPFYLAYALESEPPLPGNPEDWQAEWKWDGIRGQIIKRNNELFVWSRGEELLTEKFPEYQVLCNLLENGTVLDGEILPFRNGHPLPFSFLQTRIGRKTVTKKNLLEAPVVFFAYDLLEHEGLDWRGKRLGERRIQLESITESVSHPILQLSPRIRFSDWSQLADLRKRARDFGSEGLMLKHIESVYQTGRKRGDWWKWKMDPFTIDAVMIYAQKGHGKRGNLYTDYTFAVKDGDRLVSFAKAYSGLTDKEILEVDAFVKNNSLEKFGPVRTVRPELVFELAFEGIAASSRHKSGVALRFPRISRWRKDKLPDEINTIEDLKQMLAIYGSEKKAP